MAYVQNRDGLNRQLELVGAVDASNSGIIGDEIVRVYIADDLSRLIKPIPFPTTYATLTMGAIAANSSLIDIIAPQSTPLIFTLIRNDSASAVDIEVVTVTEIANFLTTNTNTFGMTTGVSDIGTSPAFMSRGDKLFSSGYNGGLQLPIAGSLDSSQLGDGLVVAPGQRLGFSNTTVNEALTITIAFRMVAS